MKGDRWKTRDAYTTSACLARFPVEPRIQIVGVQARGEAWNNDMGTEAMTVPVALAHDRSQDAPVAAGRPLSVTTMDPGPEPTNDDAIAWALTFIEDILVPKLLAGEPLNPAAFHAYLDDYLNIKRETLRHPISLTETVIETVLLTQVLTWRHLDRLRPHPSPRSNTYLRILDLCFGDDVDAMSS